MKGNFRSLLRKFCLESSILGLKYLYLYPDRVSRCFWSIILIATLSTASLLTQLLYHRFEEMPTRINIENQYEPVETLPYPAITVCSPNQITISAMKHLNRTFVDGNVSFDIEQVIPQLLGFYEMVGDLNEDDLKNLQRVIDLNRYSIVEVMSTLSQSCDSFLKICIFEHRNVPCKELFKPILTKHGLCCIFNNWYYLRDNRRNDRDLNFETRMVLNPGLEDGLIIVTDYDPDNAVDRTLLNAGAMRVMLTDWTEFPADDESILVQSYTESFHIIHATYTYCSEDVKQLPQNSRKCYFEDEHRLPFFQQYHNSDCDLLCLVRAVEEMCHCLMFYVPHLRVNHVCNLTHITCIMLVKRQMSKWLQNERCDCPRDCVSRRYKADFTLGNLDGLDNMPSNPYSMVTFNKSTSIMHFYIPSSVFVKQKQETVISIIILCSNLGGVFGLCLGCSVISVAEVLFYTYVFIKNCIKRRLRRTYRHHNKYNM